MVNASRGVYLSHRKTLLVVLLLIITNKTHAGPMPIPLEAQLDMARTVFIGEIFQIEKSDFWQGSGIQWGRAKIEVEETLKGAPTESAEFYVAIGFDEPNYSRGASSPPKIYGAGMSGIWLIDANDVILQAYGLHNEDRKSDVQRILKNLSERKWSEPVNGLRAWAAVVQPDDHDNQVIIFAVQNVSDSNIFVPSASVSGFIQATAKNEKNENFSYILGVTEKQSTTVFCNKLSNGQIVYLHPSYSFIDLAWEQELPPGKYSVTIECSNIRDGYTKKILAQTEPISAWKGKLQAKPVELVVE